MRDGMNAATSGVKVVLKVEYAKYGCLGGAAG